MWVYINTTVVDKLGWSKAIILEHFFIKNPHNNKAKLNVSNLSSVLPISLSTAQRSVKELVEEQYLLRSSKSKSVYSLSDKFFTTFDEYNLKTPEFNATVNGRSSK